METDTLEYKIGMLPDNLKLEANLFIDFLLFKKNQKIIKKKRVPGFLKGKISMSDDFDEPLEEFKEYL